MQRICKGFRIVLWNGGILLPLISMLPPDWVSSEDNAAEDA